MAGGSTGLVVEERDRLDDATTSAVLALVERCAEADSVRPISEHSWLHIRQGGDHGSVHLLAISSGALAGYAHLDVTDAIEGPSVELAVDPDQRRIGIGQALLERAIARSPSGRLRMWAHGENTGADRLAERMGFARVRTLWQMRRSLFSPLARAELPAGVVVAPFRVGVDEDAWLRVNARAFVDLPDQGGWTRADLDLRLGEPWFSPEGFLLAWQGGELVATALAAFGRHRESSISVTPTHPMPGMPAAESIEAFPYIEGLTPEFYRFVELRQVGGSVPFSGAGSSGLSGWSALREPPEEFHEEHLVVLADAWPPATIQMLSGFAPASSLTWTLELVAEIGPDTVPAGAVLAYEATTDAARDGYAHTHAMMWHPDGSLMAISRQTITVFG